MKTPLSNSGWDDLTQRARHDSAPSVDLPALLRAVRLEPLPDPSPWLSEFIALFEPRRVVPTCVAATCLLVAVAIWQLTEAWGALPWAQLLATGGAS